jgi:hypothetical protein
MFKVPDLCPGQEKRTDRQTDKAATICSSFEDLHKKEKKEGHNGPYIAHLILKT